MVKLRCSKPLIIQTKEPFMSIVNTLSLESNRQIKINFDGGDLSSDAGLLLIKEFVSKIGIDRLFSHSFKTNDSAAFRYHTDKENLLQMIYMIIAGYFEDDASDELNNDPVFKAVLNKEALASQPTISRFHNRLDKNSLNQFLSISRILIKKIYSIQMPEAVILNLDSIVLDAYGKQEGRAFNFHYQSNGYHPLVCYDGITGDLLKIQLRDGTRYSCTGVVDFLQPVLDEYLADYPSINLLLRGDRGSLHQNYTGNVKKMELVTSSGLMRITISVKKLHIWLVSLMISQEKTKLIML